MVNRSQKGFAAIEVILIVIVIALIGGAGYFVWHGRQTPTKNPSDSSKTKKAPIVSSYEECMKLDSSRVLETYPQQCVTKDGQKFTQPQELTAITIPYTDSEDEQTSYSFKYPSTWQVNDKRNSSVIIQSPDYSVEQKPIGGKVTAGAEVDVYARLKNKYASDSLYDNIPTDSGTLDNLTEITVAGLPALKGSHTYRGYGYNMEMVVFLKGDTLFVIQEKYSVDVVNPYPGIVDEIIKSFKL